MNPLEEKKEAKSEQRRNESNKKTWLELEITLLFGRLLLFSPQAGGPKLVIWNKSVSCRLL